MHLNRISLEGPPNAAPSLQGPQKKSYEVGEGDFLWEAEGRSQFPKVAGELDAQIKQYQRVKISLNKAGTNSDHQDCCIP